MGSGYEDDGEEGDAVTEDIAQQYLRKIASMSGAHKTFGLRIMISFTSKTRKQIKEINIIVDGKEYVGTPGLRELIVETTPDDKMFTIADLIIMLK